MSVKTTPVVRDEGDELLGYVGNQGKKWFAMTIFGYVFEELPTKNEAETAVREKGLAILTGPWQYYDEKTDSWGFCVIKEANTHTVTVIKTNMFGYQDTQMSATLKLDRPAEQLRK